MIQIILVVLGIYLLYLLIRYVIIPISGVVLVITAAIGVLYALFISLKSFIKSLIENINPYNTYIDKSKNAIKGINRNYFFGPGYHQVIETVKGTFSHIKDELDNLVDLKDDKMTYKWYFDMWIWIFFVLAYGCICAFGFVWAAVFSVILISIIFVVMCVFFTFFSLLWFSDRITLMIKSIYSRCGECKKISVVPLFLCPNQGCGFEHKNLTPGPYGIFYRKCNCKKLIPTTIYNGRSRLQAFCPYCNAELANSGANHFGIQLVGGTSAGKTTFLAAFLHIYPNLLKTTKKIQYEKFPEKDFNELENWFQKGFSSSTSNTNAAMYSIIKKQGRKVPYQLTIYDIAGEAFRDLGNNRQQLQFEYCDIILFIIDPTANPNSINEDFSTFISEFKRLKGLHSNRKSKITIAVIISKADLFKSELDINRSENGNNEVCINFLQKKGFGNLLNLIESEFFEAKYFAVSAMGHKPISGEPYQPWGVEEVAKWIKKHSNKYF